ncbi:hypothetical protein SLS61_002909, partial [Didymella pomorum]
EKSNSGYDDFLRLDCQSVTSDAPLRFNLQVQVNFESPDTSLKHFAPSTVAYTFVPVNAMWSPDEIKMALKPTVNGWVIPRPGPDSVLEDNLAGKGKKSKKK